MLASLRAFPRPGVSASDLTADKQKARDLFDQALRTLEGVSCTPYAQRRATATFGDDIDMFVEIARLWQDDHTRMRTILQDAIRASESANRSEPRLVNNTAVLKHLWRCTDAADGRQMMEEIATNLVACSTTMKLELEA